MPEATPSIEAQLRAAGMSPRAAAAKAAIFARLGGGFAVWAPQRRAAPPRAWYVPGRIEVLGKHTDYAGGRSLLCAAERGFCVLAAPRQDARLWLRDVDWQSEAAWDLGGVPPPVHWALYPATVAQRLQQDFPELRRGLDMVFASDLPRAAGMSSSSALVIASFFALAAANDLDQTAAYGRHLQERQDLASYMAAIESGSGWGPWPARDGVGTHGGSEDHTAILCCQPATWSQYAFCPVRLEQRLAAPAGHVLVIAASGVTASKTGSAREAYNRAADSARRLLRLWNAAGGRSDPTLAAALATGPGAQDLMRRAIEAAPAGEFSPAQLRARLDQFVLESEGVIPGAVAALAQRDWARFGGWVGRSQQAAEAGLDNQIAETRWLAGAARRLGAVAASAFGAGFGGAVWALAEAATAREFRHAWQAEYRQEFAPRASQSLFFESGAGPAALELSYDGH